MEMDESYPSLVTVKEEKLDFEEVSLTLQSVKLLVLSPLFI